MGDIDNLVMSWRSTMMFMVCCPIGIASVLLWMKTSEQKATRYLAGFFFFGVLAIMPQIIGFAGFYDVWPGLTFFPFSNELWLGPLLYLHAYSLIYGQPLGWRKWLLLPGIIQTLYYFWAFTSLGNYEQKWAFSKSFHSPYIAPVEAVLSIGLLTFALYKVWYWHNAYKEFLQRTQSTAEEFEPVWLHKIVIAIGVGALIFSGIEIADVWFELSYRAAFPFQVLLMAMMAWVAIESVWRLHDAYPKIALQNAETFDDKQEAEKTESQEQHSYSEEGQKIRHQVFTNQWFLEPRFSLRDLAQRLGSNELYVSRYINQGLDVSFNDFVNGLRVEFAKHLLLHSSQQVLSIALDSGFNSKATFNRVFKEHTHMTPTQFRKKYTQAT